MQAAMLPDRGVIKVAGDAARTFLNGIVTNDIDKVAPGAARFAALLTPQGKIIADFIVVEAPPEDGGAFFLDVPKALAPDLARKLNFYKLRAKVTIDDLSAALGVMAVWDGQNSGNKADTGYGLCYPDPRLAALGMRAILPSETAREAATDLGAMLVEPDAYEAHRIALGVPRGGHDFIYADAFPHEADMDQLGGIDFKKGCYIGQEIVSRVEHRSTARSRVVPVSYEHGAPMPGIDVMAGGKQVGMMGSAAQGRGLAMLRLDKVTDAIAAGTPLIAGGITLRVVKPGWATFTFPGDVKA